MNQTPARRQVAVEALTAEAFAPFGDVIEASERAHHRSINAGFAERYDELARIDTGSDGGHPVVSIFRARPRALPLRLTLMERHPLGSQAFVPLAPLRFLVVVAAAGPAPGVDDVRAFLAGAGQGVNLARGTWHHPLLALDAGGDFLVIDRGGPGAADDCDEHPIEALDLWLRL
jgi:ureidoglycolate lyase